MTGVTMDRVKGPKSRQAVQALALTLTKMGHSDVKVSYTGPTEWRIDFHSKYLNAQAEIRAII